MLALVLAVQWFLMSGQTAPLILFFGVTSIALTVLLARRMAITDREGFPIHLLPRLVSYLPWLGREIAKSNWAVARIILNPRLPISPSMQTFRVAPRTDLGKVIYGNSITLTPGTITTGIAGDEFEIHALTRAAWDGTEEGEMGRRICQLEDAP